jgi:hypothetical protein
MTECTQETFGFTAHFSRRVEAEFTAGQVSSDGGVLLLREVDRRINLFERLAGCFFDGRSPLLVRHQLPEMLAQRIYGLTLGYEDLNDHDELRRDPLLGLVSGKRSLEEELAGKSTLNRLELAGRTARYHKINYSAEAMDRLLVDLYLESQSSPPEQIVLDLDATDIPLCGHQPERFFHGYYDSLLLSAAVYLCRRPVTVRATAAGQPRRGCGFGQGSQPHRGADAPALARSEDRAPS